MELLSMAVVKFEKDGQGFYDFDALLKATSEEFVQKVKSDLDYYDSIGRSYMFKFDEVLCSFYIIAESTVSIYRYYKDTGNIRSNFILGTEILELAGMFNE